VTYICTIIFKFLILKGALGNLRLGLYSKEFRNFLSNVTGIELNTTVDISASWYKKGKTDDYFDV
jgi:hypothetical protein